MDWCQIVEIRHWDSSLRLYLRIAFPYRCKIATISDVVKSWYLCALCRVDRGLSCKVDRKVPATQGKLAIEMFYWGLTALAHDRPDILQE